LLLSGENNVEVNRKRTKLTAPQVILKWVLNMPLGVDANGKPIEAPPAWLALLFPIGYLVMGYAMTAIGCWLYNGMFKYIGGIEYETRDKDA